MQPSNQSVRYESRNVAQVRMTVARAAIALGCAAAMSCLSACGNPSGPRDGALDGADVATSDGRLDSTIDGSETSVDIDAGLDATLDANEAVALTVDPPMSTLTVTDRTIPQTAALTAHARTSDGRDVVVTPDWSVDRADVLTVGVSGVATTTNTTGGDVVVTARFGALTATATVRVILSFAIVIPGTPPGTEALFPPGGTPTVDAARQPSMVYPASETVFPQNVYKVLFQWRGAGNDRFRVRFESDRTHVDLYTAGVHATCTAAGTGLSCFEPTLDIWRFIAGSNPHGTVTVTIDGARSTAPGQFYRSAPITLGFSRGPVPGAIYYWSTTARGVRRATVSDSAPTNFLTPTETDGACVACHTLSRRGNRMAADVGGNNLWIVEVSPTFPPPRLVTRFGGAVIPSFWATFSFDETRVISAARGVLTLRDAATGGPINTLTIPGAAHFGTQPDWAPDNTLVAFAQSTATRDRGVSGARIATIQSMPGDTWGAVQMLYGTGVSTDTNQYPSFSWDSQWIAFTHSTSDGENDNTTDLWLMSRTGMGPRALTRANTIVNDGTVATATIEDSMSTWAPSGVPNDYAWVAFTSNRDYGGVLSPASHLGRHKQVWVAAIDLTRAATADSSYPAFRLPFQDLDEDAHRPFWAEDRVRPDPDAGVDAGVDAVSPDASDAGGADVMCAPSGADCAANPCCPGFTCWDDGAGGFSCQTIPM